MSTIGKSSTIIKYLKNNRLRIYDEILDLAKQKGYDVVSLSDWLNISDKNKSNKHLILRHDVDHASEATLKMLNIEHARGCTASYYFRKHTAEKRIIEEIKSKGGEVSLHFETLSDFVNENRWIKSEYDLKRADAFSVCLDRLKADLNSFRDIYGVPAITIAAHGAPENKAISVPNNRLTEIDYAYDYLGIYAEAYDRKVLEKFTSYISDCPIEINDGYRYVDTPISCLNRGDNNILFLTHPNHWYYTRTQLIKKIIKICLIKE